MDALNRLQFYIMQDELREHFNNFRHNCYTFLSRHKNRVGVSLAEAGHESEGRVWVEVGSEGLRLRVTHLHPANPSVAEALKRKCAERREAQRMGKDESILTGKLIYPPQDDKISLSSLEDYWFNHWQGPYITADTNQNSYNLAKLRRSHRKSKRSNRCSICHKKLVRTESEENREGQCVERDDNVLAHMPSIVKLEARTLKDDFDDKSDDEFSKPSVSDDTLSRCSANEEQQHTRMHRVVDNELRTSYSLFANDIVSQDVIDAFVSMDTTEKLHEPSTTHLRSPPLSPRQSRSCPCSPKLSRRTYSSPESIANSPKSRSFVGISKFSLSNSLLAIHRQASNSRVPEFLKFDSGKSESPGASKHNSLKSECQKIRHSLTESSHKEEHLESESGQIGTKDSGDLPQVPSKSSLAETQSLPTLKLSRMSLTYRSGVPISEEDTCAAEDPPPPPTDATLLPPTDSALLPPTDAALLPPTDAAPPPPTDTAASSSNDFVVAADNSEGADRQWNTALPDVVPVYSLEKGLASQPLTTTSGVVNLGFDGTEESSDFIEVKLESDEEMENEDASANATGGASSAKVRETMDLHSSLPRSSSLQGASGTGSGASEAGTASTHTAETLVVQNPVDTLPPRVHNGLPDPTDGAQYNTFIEKDVMQEAREMVFWWRRTLPAEEESEFCLHHTECKVKQKPLLIFLHGVGSSADVWNQQLWYFLSCGYEVVAPDLLGHGLSSAPKNRKFYNFSRMLDYISLVFDLFVPQGRKCIVVGHNYGCALAVALARGRPSSVGLVILASSGGPSPLVPHTKYENSLSSTVTRILNPFISCGCLSRELLYTPRGKHYPVVSSDETGVCSTPKYVLEYTSEGQHWPEGDLAFHRRISIPVLLLYGMKDTCVSFVDMCEMEKTIPRAFLELIPGAGHELMTDRAEEVCHAMHRFVRRWKQHI